MRVWAALVLDSTHVCISFGGNFNGIRYQDIIPKLDYLTFQQDNAHLHVTITYRVFLLLFTLDGHVTYWTPLESHGWVCLPAGSSSPKQPSTLLLFLSRRLIFLCEPEYVQYIQKCGVPQGLVLSPVCFNLYMLALEDISMRHAVSSPFYADVTLLYIAMPPDDTGQAELTSF